MVVFNKQPVAFPFLAPTAIFLSFAEMMKYTTIIAWLIKTGVATFSILNPNLYFNQSINYRFLLR